MLIVSSPSTSNRSSTAGGLLDAVRGWQPSTRVATLAIVATSIAYASTTIFIRLLTDRGMSVIAVAFFRFVLTAVVLGRFLNLSASKQTATAWGLVSGVVMGGGWIVYVRTIDTADVAVAGVVQMTYPLFALISGWLCFKARLTVRSVIASLLVVVAAVVGLGVGAGGGSGLSLLLFAAPASFGFSVSVLTERLGSLDPFERLASVTVGASIAMSPLLFTVGVDEVIPTSVVAVVCVLAIGAISTLIPMVIYAAAAPTIGTARTAAAGAFELPMMFLIGSLFFGEATRVGHVVAAAIIVAAIGLTRSARSTHVIPDGDRPSLTSAAATPVRRKPWRLSKIEA